MLIRDRYVCTGKKMHLVLNWVLLGFWNFTLISSLKQPTNGKDSIAKFKNTTENIMQMQR